METKLYGILNGIDMDLYDPRRDKHLPFSFSVNRMEGKADCKRAIQA